jgi:hypothetical protein
VIRRYADDETPPTPATEQHGSDRTHEYGGLGGKLEPPPFGGRRCLLGGYVVPPTTEQGTKLQGALPKMGTFELSTTTVAVQQFSRCDPGHRSRVQRRSRWDRARTRCPQGGGCVWPMSADFGVADRATGFVVAAPAHQLSWRRRSV